MLKLGEVEHIIPARKHYRRKFTTTRDASANIAGRSGDLASLALDPHLHRKHRYLQFRRDGRSHGGVRGMDSVHVDGRQFVGSRQIVVNVTESAKNIRQTP